MKIDTLIFLINKILKFQNIFFSFLFLFFHEKMDWMTYSTEKVGNLAPKNRKKNGFGWLPLKKNPSQESRRQGKKNKDKIIKNN